ncbi:MAG: hypothetical protein PUF06_02950 [Veillonellaceae bacterium]|nr:hypothetical protein [Veillonellaceae bacterium]MDD6562069.1 hypothetical protein [Veillonellaceae bacterium]MEE0458622.1 hypothetical protein [Anaerovibrio sp.]
MTKENAIKYGEIISKCWEDEVYREEFIRDPESVMLEKGIELEEGITYKVIQAPKLVEYFVLPYDNVREPIQNFAKFLLNKAEQSDKIVPDGFEYRIIQNTEDVHYLILPASPKTLTAAELAQISGADSAVTATNVVAQAEAAVQVVAAVEVVAAEATVAATSLAAGAEVAVLVAVVLI